MKKSHQKTNAIVETRTFAYQMVTAKQVVLYINALPQPSLMQTKYTQEQLHETSKSDAITTRHFSTKGKLQMTPLCRNTYGKERKNTRKCCP